MFSIHLIPRDRVFRVWTTILPSIDIYRMKSPHLVASDEEILWDLTSEDGDRLVVVSMNRQYAGFLTFRVAEVEAEIWGTLGMICMTEEAQTAGVLPAIMPQMENLLRSFGCGIMNYMTARKGFARLAPKLGFRSRIIEWMKEL